MRYVRSAIERESPEMFGYDRIKYNLSESSATDLTLGALGPLDLSGLDELKPLGKVGYIDLESKTGFAF